MWIICDYTVDYLDTGLNLDWKCRKFVSMNFVIKCVFFEPISSLVRWHVFVSFLFSGKITNKFRIGLLTLIVSYFFALFHFIFIFNVYVYVLYALSVFIQYIYGNSGLEDETVWFIFWDRSNQMRLLKLKVLLFGPGLHYLWAYTYESVNGDHIFRFSLGTVYFPFLSDQHFVVVCVIFRKYLLQNCFLFGVCDHHIQYELERTRPEKEILGNWVSVKFQRRKIKKRSKKKLEKKKRKSLEPLGTIR